MKSKVSDRKSYKKSFNISQKVCQSNCGPFLANRSKSLLHKLQEKIKFFFLFLIIQKMHTSFFYLKIIFVLENSTPKRMEFLREIFFFLILIIKSSCCFIVQSMVSAMCVKNITKLSNSHLYWQCGALVVTQI